MLRNEEKLKKAKIQKNFGNMILTDETYHISKKGFMSNKPRYKMGGKIIKQGERK